MKNNLYLCLSILLGLYACSDGESMVDPAPTPSYDQELSFVAGSVGTSSKTTGEYWSEWELGDSIRMSYITNLESTVPFSDRYYFYQTAEAGDTVALVSGDSCITTAFGATGAETISVFAYSANGFDMFEDTVYNQYYSVDIAKTSKAGVITNPIYSVKSGLTIEDAESPVSLNFKHALSSIIIKFKGYDPEESIYDGLKVFATGLNTTAVNEWKFSSDSLPYLDITSEQTSPISSDYDTIWFQDRQDTIMYEYEDDFQYEAEFPPQAPGSTPFVMHFVVKASGEDFVFTFPYEFKTGERYTITVDLFDPNTDFVITNDFWDVISGDDTSLTGEWHEDADGNDYLNVTKP